MITVKEILEGIDFIKFIGNEEQHISKVIKLDASNIHQDTICWCNDKNLHNLKKTYKGTVICSNKVLDVLHDGIKCNLIIVDNPRFIFASILSKHFAPNIKQHEISLRAFVDSNSKIGKNVFIGDFTVIEKGVVIGDNTYIGYNNTVLEKTVIGNNVKIGSNNTIGGVGFGYEMNEEGKHVLIPHVGNVEIKNNVEIGNNNCIDKAVLGSTIISENVKIDNLVHIAHGVKIGKNSLIISNSMIAGSCNIGENVWIAPSSSIINNCNIGDNAVVGIGSVVLNAVEKKEVVVGVPAKPLVRK